MTALAKRTLVLFLMLAVTAVPPQPAAAEDEAPTEMVMMDPRALEFTPIPDMPSCASAATLRGNPRTGPAWVLLKLNTGCRVPLHWHTPNEYLLVISGQGVLIMKDGSHLQFAPGAYTALPSRHMHMASCTEECLLFAAADGAFDIHYVDENGEEISAEEALKASEAEKKRSRK